MVFIVGAIILGLVTGYPTLLKRRLVVRVGCGNSVHDHPKVSIPIFPRQDHMTKQQRSMEH